MRATDLNQGVVYGIDTPETTILKSLNTSFHYDHIFGTVINRFLVQAAINKPLTIYGKGTQIRTFLNINDTLQCIELAIKNPAKISEYKVRNQFTEIFSINQIANLICASAKKIGLKPKIQYLRNPRIEQPKHFYKPSNKSFIKIGLKKRKFSEEFIIQNLYKIIKLKGLINKKIIDPTITWKYK